MSVATNGVVTKGIAILIENLFEDSEFQIPYTALQRAGAKVTLLGSRMNDEYHGKQGKVSVKPDATATEVRSEDFDAILIPGGIAPDRIRCNPNALRLIMDGMGQGKTIGAVGQGLQVAIETDQIRSKRVTGFRSIRKDIQNAGAIYVDDAVVIDGNLITSRQPSDLPLFTAAILALLGLSIEGTTLPDTSDVNFEWWQLGAEWGGSSREEIIAALNTAYAGERYTLEAFKGYSERAANDELGLILKEVVLTKQSHVELLEARLQDFNEQVSWQATVSDAYANLQNWLQSVTSESDDLALLRRALGDIQTGVVDAFNFTSQVSDPKSARIFDQVEANLAQHEERLSDFYRAHYATHIQPPTPTSLSLTRG